MRLGDVPTGIRFWFVGAVALLISTGCRAPSDILWDSAWVADYDTAEARFDNSDKELLIFYKNPRRDADIATEKALKSAPIKQQVKDMIVCTLYKSYEPDRRYVAQYGVDRAPALVLVHRDGTYHARSGPMTAADLEAFLAQAKPPGRWPAFNPHIPRKARYHWSDSLADAQAAASRTRRPILVVYYRSLSSDWRQLSKLLARQEVYTRFAGLAHCRISIMNPWAAAYVTPFGALQLPAIVLVRRDGTYAVLEMPTTYEAVVHFADATLSPQATTESATVTDRREANFNIGMP